MWDLWCTNWHWDRVFSDTLVFPFHYNAAIFVSILLLLEGRAGEDLGTSKTMHVGIMSTGQRTAYKLFLWMFPFGCLTFRTSCWLLYVVIRKEATSSSFPQRHRPQFPTTPLPPVSHNATSSSSPQRHCPQFPTTPLPPVSHNATVPSFPHRPRYCTKPLSGSPLSAFAQHSPSLRELHYSKHTATWSNDVITHTLTVPPHSAAKAWH